MARLRWRILPHTADVRLMVWGDDERGLVENAVAGATRIALGRTAARAPTRWTRISRWPRARAGRLVAAVNEALFRLYRHHAVAVALRSDANGAWLGLVDLPVDCRPLVEIKAATFHDLNVQRHHDRLRAVITLDV
jgi:SHS2 domain-containing protein